MHGQGKFKSTIIAGRAVYNNPIALVRTPKKLGPVPNYQSIKVRILPAKTPVSAVEQRIKKDKKEYNTQPLELLRNINSGTDLLIDVTTKSSGINLTKITKKNIRYDETLDNSAEFELTDNPEMPNGITKIEFQVTMTANNEERPFFVEDYDMKVGNVSAKRESYVKTSLFEDRDSLIYWKNFFIEFLDAHENEFKNAENKYSINASEFADKNQVSFAFAAFLEIWLNNNNVKYFSAPACWRFLIEEPHIKPDNKISNGVTEYSWRNWFRVWFDKVFKKKPDLKDNGIREKVKKWFAEKGLNRPTK
jgi:hypothetical protein